MTTGTARELADAFARFGPPFMHWMKAGLRDENLTFARMRLLWAIEAAGPQIMSELKDTLGVTARSVTSLVDGLEADGYVTRRPHPEDRRATVIELTPDGEEAMERVHRLHQARAAELFADLPDADQHALLRIMEDLVDTVQGRVAQEASR